MAALLTGLVLLFATPAWAAEVVLATPGTASWQPLDFPKIPRHTTYTVVHSDGRNALKAQADCSASARYLSLENLDLTQTPRLRWRWKVEQGLHTTDERVKAGDDFAARVYVMFEFDPRHASIWERARHTLATKLYGHIIPGDTINYVWSSREAAGAKWDSPYGSGSKIVSLGTGALPDWSEAVVDVVADYAALFGHPPAPPLAVALMTDTDNTCRQATAYYADFRFVSR